MQFAVLSARYTLKTKKVHDDSMETAQPVPESVTNSKLINSILQSAVEDMKLACKADSTPGMNSDVLLKKNTTKTVLICLLFKWC